MKQRVLFPGGTRKKKVGDYNLSVATSLEYHPSWRFPKWLDSLVGKQLQEGFSLNLCCGKSKFGSIRVDILSRLKPDFQSDLYHLPFRENTFDKVFCDPPYLVGNGSGRWRIKPLVRELIRVTKPGGLIIFMHYWFIHPMGDSSLELLEYYAIPDKKPTAHNRTLSINRKVNYSLTQMDRIEDSWPDYLNNLKTFRCDEHQVGFEHGMEWSEHIREKHNISKTHP